jgi:hypothetical protein
MARTYRRARGKARELMQHSFLRAPADAQEVRWLTQRYKTPDVDAALKRRRRKVFGEGTAFTRRSDDGRCRQAVTRIKHVTRSRACVQQAVRSNDVDDVALPARCGFSLRPL